MGEHFFLFLHVFKLKYMHVNAMEFVIIMCLPEAKTVKMAVRYSYLGFTLLAVKFSLYSSSELKNNCPVIPLKIQHSK